ncbi:hypothetical protein PWW31_18490 [Vibrio harveyi]|nr:hypothetical protein PWW31_18490 [Vibrio harveyi]
MFCSSLSGGVGINGLVSNMGMGMRSLSNAAKGGAGAAKRAGQSAYSGAQSLGDKFKNRIRPRLTPSSHSHPRHRAALRGFFVSKKDIFMKTFTLLLVACLTVGCSSTPPPPPEPKGDITPVNPSKVNLADLYTQGDIQ